MFYPTELSVRLLPLLVLLSVSGTLWSDEHETAPLSTEELREHIEYFYSFRDFQMETNEMIADGFDLTFDSMESLTDDYHQHVEDVRDGLEAALDAQETVNEAVLEMLERHKRSLQLSWFVRLVLLPFTLVSAGVGLKTAWDRFGWKAILVNLLRRKQN